MTILAIVLATAWLTVLGVAAVDHLEKYLSAQMRTLLQEAQPKSRVVPVVNPR